MSSWKQRQPQAAMKLPTHDNIARRIWFSQEWQLPSCLSVGNDDSLGSYRPLKGSEKKGKIRSEEKTKEGIREGKVELDTRWHTEDGESRESKAHQPEKQPQICRITSEKSLAEKGSLMQTPTSLSTLTFSELSVYFWLSVCDYHPGRNVVFFCFVRFQRLKVVCFARLHSCLRQSHSTQLSRTFIFRLCQRSMERKSRK